MKQRNDPYDELAELFLTDAPPDERTGATATAEPETRITLCVVGHLPVRAGLWLSPYAAAVARGYGATALVRLDDDAASIELFGASENLASRLRAASDTDRLSDAISALARGTRDQSDDAVRHWILRPASTLTDADDTAAWFSGSDTAASVDDVHIVTGVDDAAVVAAYQSIKRVAEAASDTGRRPPSIGLAVVGTTTDAARQMVERLNRTARSFLGVEATLAVCLHQIGHEGASSGRVTFDRAAPPSPRQLLEWIAIARDTAVDTHLHQHTDDRPDEPPDIPPEPSVVDSPRRFEPGASGDSSDAYASPRAMRDTDHPEESGDREVVTTRATVNFAKSFKLRPKPAARTAAATLERKHPQRVREPDHAGRPVPLADHIEGVTDLPVRCPGHEHVEIGVDANGHMHLMTWEPSLRDLHVVSRWVQRHRELITLACREHQFAADHAPVLHVLTESPQSVADLHGSSLHLHVVAPVRVKSVHAASDDSWTDDDASGRGWYVAQLNQPAQA
jgi:hypothetical protein